MTLEKSQWSREDRELYNELFYGYTPYHKLSEKEQEFCKIMYIMEEYAYGLDG